MTIQIAETKHLKDFPSSSAEIAPMRLLDGNHIRAVLLNLDAGQAVAPCRMSATVLYYVVEGRGSLLVGDEEVRLQAGSLALVPAGAERTIVADEPTRVLGVQVL